MSTNYINQRKAWIRPEAHMLEEVIKEVVASIKKDKIDMDKLSELSRFVENGLGGIQIGDVDPVLKAKALTDNILLAFETREIGGVHSFLSTNDLNGQVFVLGVSNKGFSRKYDEDEVKKEEGTTAVGRNILTNIAKRLHKLSNRYDKHTAINVLNNWKRLIDSSLDFITIADIIATQLAKTPIAKSSEMSATEIFKDAVRQEPQTDIGHVARKEIQKELLEKYVA